MGQFSGANFQVFSNFSDFREKEMKKRGRKKGERGKAFTLHIVYYIIPRDPIFHYDPPLLLPQHHYHEELPFKTVLIK